MKNIILIGMPGTGKSTVGVILAKRLGYDFLDTDVLLCKRENRTLPEILEQDGIDKFLMLEGLAGQSIDCTKTIIATGGSMVFSDKAMTHMKKNGVVIWLKTPLDEIERRISKNAVDRGVAAPGGMSVEDIYEQRRSLYEKYADIMIECETGTDEVVAQIREALNK